MRRFNLGNFARFRASGQARVRAASRTHYGTVGHVVCQRLKPTVVKEAERTEWPSPNLSETIELPTTSLLPKHCIFELLQKIMEHANTKINTLKGYYLIYSLHNAQHMAFCKVFFLFFFFFANTFFAKGICENIRKYGSSLLRVTSKPWILGNHAKGGLRADDGKNLDM